MTNCEESQRDILLEIAACADGFIEIASKDFGFFVDETTSEQCIEDAVLKDTLRPTLTHDLVCGPFGYSVKDYANFLWNMARMSANAKRLAGEMEP